MPTTQAGVGSSRHIFQCLRIYFIKDQRIKLVARTSSDIIRQLGHNKQDQ